MASIPSGSVWIEKARKGLIMRWNRVAVPAFHIDLSEVTVAAYRRCVQAGLCSEPATLQTCNYRLAGRDRAAVNCVSLHQASVYCRWVGKRLPTEAEWMFAARGSDRRLYPWGDRPPEGRVCSRRWESQLGPCSTGEFPTGDSPFGLHDMAGNVWEWTATRVEANHDPALLDGTNPDPDKGQLHVIRGGGWGDVQSELFSFVARGTDPPGVQNTNYGFRCAR